MKIERNGTQIRPDFRQMLIALAVASCFPHLTYAGEPPVSGVAGAEAPNVGIAQQKTDSAAPTEEPDTGGATQAGRPGSSLGRMVIRGLRASNTASIAAKRKETRIVDAISADDARALPDTSVADTIKRAPGVSVNFNNDTRTGRDDAQRPTIRGLDARYNNSTIDGAPLAANEGTSGNNLRGARLDLFPASMLKRVEIFKTWTPDQDVNSIGGSVNVVTRSAFDGNGKTFVSANGAVGQVSEHNKPFKDKDDLPKRFDTTFSKTFGEDKNLGLVVSADYKRVDTFSLAHMVADTNPYNFYKLDGTLSAATFAGNASSNGVTVPAQNKFWLLQLDQEKKGLSTKLEANITPSIYVYGMLGIYQQKKSLERYETIIDPKSTKNTVQDGSSGNFATGIVQTGYGDYEIEKSTQIFNLGGKWQISDLDKFDIRYSYSVAKHNENNTFAKYESDATSTSTSNGKVSSGNGFSYDSSSFDQSTTFANPVFVNDSSNYKALFWNKTENKGTTPVSNMRVDYQHNLDDAARGLGYQAGINYTDTKTTVDVNVREWRPTASGANMRSVLRGTYSLPNTNGYNAFLIDPNVAFGQLSNGLGSPIFMATSSLQQSSQDDYSVSEKILAGYAAIGYTTDQLRVMFGLRDDRADVTSHANQCTAKTTGKNCSNDTAAVWSETGNSTSYSYLLPAANIIYKPLSNVTIRSSYTQTIGRPDYSNYAPRVSVTQLNSGGPYTVNMGNPDIKPREANNYDLSGEWYFKQGLVSLAIFKKDIKNEIFNYTYSTTWNGIDRSTVTQSKNAGNSRLNGFELGAVLNSFDIILPALRNMGTSVNYTKLNGSMDVPVYNDDKTYGIRTVNNLINQPRDIFNWSLFYTDANYEFRAAYNKVGKSLRLIDNLPWNDLYWKDRAQIDLSARYRITENLSVFAEVANATKEPVVSLTGPSKSLLKDTYTVPSSYWLGLTYVLK